MCLSVGRGDDPVVEIEREGEGIVQEAGIDPPAARNTDQEVETGGHGVEIKGREAGSEGHGAEIKGHGAGSGGQEAGSGGQGVGREGHGAGSGG